MIVVLRKNQKRRYARTVFGVVVLQCRKCKTVYPQTMGAFPSDSTKGGGLAQCTHACKTCIQAEIDKQLKHRQENPELYRVPHTKWGLK